MKVKRYFLEVHDPGIVLVHPGYMIAEYFIPEFGLFINKEATFSHQEQDADKRVACGKNQKEFEITDSAVISLVAELRRRIDMRKASEERVNELVATIRKENSLNDFETEREIVFCKGKHKIILKVGILNDRVSSIVHLGRCTLRETESYSYLPGGRLTKAIRVLKREGYTEVMEP